MKTLQDRIALVTGATAYIGRAAAQELAQRGALVVVNGRNAASGQAVVDEIHSAGGRAEFEAADLTDREAVQAMVGRIVQRHGRLDVLVASGAGASSDSLAFKLFMEMEGADFETYIRSHWLTRAHAVGHFSRCCRAFSPASPHPARWPESSRRWQRL